MMKNDVVINKKVILFVLLIALVLFVAFAIFVYSEGEKSTNNVNENEKTDTNIDNEEDEKVSFIGKYINESDKKSFFEIQSDGTFHYVANGCEGYFNYTNENYTLDIKNSKTSVTISILSNTNENNNYFVFNSKEIIELNVVSLTGPNSCSSSNIFIKSN